ncbi:MAG: STAS domain-containing protein [Candidatus Gracilibacteria bacterium]|jgi:anti-anti-sigma factor
MTEVTITIEDSQSPVADKKLKIVHISGQLDESNVDEKIQMIYKLLEEIPQNLTIIMDFENLTYMNSKSIGYLTDLYGKLNETNGKIVIAKAKPNILDILQVVGLAQLIPCFDSTDMAKASLVQSAPASVPTPTPTQVTPAPTPVVTPTPAAPVAPVVPTPVAEPAPVHTPAPEAPVTPAQPVSADQPTVGYTFEK